MDSKFWDNVYETKSEDAVSWYQDTPKNSLEIILDLKLSLDVKIIDVGGGQSKLTECLYSNSYTNLSVLDISEAVLIKLKKTLNDKFPDNNISTIVSNIVDTKFPTQFDLWHDRAVFHFLTNPIDQEKYVNLLENSLRLNGHFLISTFSKSGPLKCSGLEICQYDVEDLVAKFKKFKLIKSGNEDHHTPFGTIQKFTYCLFKK